MKPQTEVRAWAGTLDMMNRPVAWTGRPTFRLLAYGLTGLFLVLFVSDMLAVTRWRSDQLQQAALGDFRIYTDAAHRWLDTGEWYRPRQLAPYAIETGDILYPPVLLWLLVPFALLPSPLSPFLFVTVPVVIVAWVVWRHRPAVWAWPLLAVCLWFWRTPSQVIHGNPVIWIAATVALGTIYRWPAVFALVKVSVAPFALVGIRRRSWWLGLGLLGLLSLPFLADTLLYPSVLMNSRGYGGWTYSLPEYPMLALPVIAWLAQSAHHPLGQRRDRACPQDILAEQNRDEEGGDPVAGIAGHA